MEARRASLAVVGQALLAAEGPVKREVASARRAWPFVDHGVVGTGKHQGRSPAASRGVSRQGREAIAVASKRAERLPPTLVPNSEMLIGPGAGVAAIFESFSGLADHGWSHIRSTVNAIGFGPAAARSFLSANVNTYIIAVYDGHFDLSEAGKSLAAAYERLGAGAAFGHRLTEAQVDEISRFYSPGNIRLNPHPWQQLVEG